MATGVRHRHETREPLRSCLGDDVDDAPGSTVTAILAVFSIATVGARFAVFAASAASTVHTRKSRRGDVDCAGFHFAWGEEENARNASFRSLEYRDDDGVVKWRRDE